jgi:hypothetical protein
MLENIRAITRYHLFEYNLTKLTKSQTNKPSYTCILIKELIYIEIFSVLQTVDSSGLKSGLGDFFGMIKGYDTYR